MDVVPVIKQWSLNPKPVLSLMLELGFCQSNSCSAGCFVMLGIASRGRWKETAGLEEAWETSSFPQ